MPRIALTNPNGGVAGAAAWFIAPIACVLAFRYALLAWFQQDDFVWLGFQPSNLRELVQGLFQPTPHGTLRPWSDRAFFLALRTLFGLNALPFHVAVFGMQFANLALLGSLVSRLTRSRTAGVVAPLLWVVNPVLVLPMVWISGVYQIMGALCFLSALRAFVHYSDTGNRAYLLLTWAVFLLGLGVIESIIVFPAMAAAFAICFAPARLKHALGMLSVSVAFTVARLTLASRHDVGPYALHVDSSILPTLMSYWRLAAGADEGMQQIVAAVTVTAALLAFAAARAARRDFLPVVFLAWFILPLAPVLPLRDHVTDYYLTIPFIAIAGLASYAVARASSARAFQPWLRIGVGVLAAGYIVDSVQVADAATRWWYARSKRVQHAFEAVRTAHRGKPDGVILLAGVDADLFWSCVLYRPFRLAGINEVFLAPGSEARITTGGGLPPLSHWMLSSSAIAGLRAENRLIVLSLVNERFIDTTREWTAPDERGP